MPRAEHSQDLGELFRQKVGNVLIYLRYDVMGEKYPFKCKSTVFHGSTEHTVDILARHSHSGGHVHKKTIVIESKKTFPSPADINHVVVDLANKIDCLSKKPMYSETDEGMILTDSNISLNQEEAFKRASEKIATSRGYVIGLISGSKFRLLEALSFTAKEFSSSKYSVSIINCLNKPEQDLGSICPMSIGENSRLYLCAMKAGEIRLSVFRIDGENYVPENFMEDMEWIKNYSGIFDKIHSVGGFTDKAVQDIKAAGLNIGIIDHNLLKCINTQYLNYTVPP